jgi:phosphoglycolate phosphatase-like HAD superfamily hydrolase
MLYPGVRQLLTELRQMSDLCVALLTGNIERGAVLKLESAGIDHFFAFGAFGSDCEQRTGLPAIAVQRARASTSREFKGREVIIIGDTPSDMTCGQSLGVFSLGVATGRHSRQDLLAAGAHVVVSDLADTAAMARLMAG